jgi:hypothetical protein
MSPLLLILILLLCLAGAAVITHTDLMVESASAESSSLFS